MSSEWVSIWRVCRFASLLRAMCAFGEMFPRVYPVHLHKTDTQKALPNMDTQMGTPTVSDYGKTPGCTSDQEADGKRREERRRQDGLFSSVRDASCMMSNGIPTDRLKKKICKRAGWGLVTLLIAYDLYSGGVLAKPSTTEWANSQLRAHSPTPIYSRSRGYTVRR